MNQIKTLLTGALMLVLTSGLLPAKLVAQDCFDDVGPQQLTTSTLIMYGGGAVGITRTGAGLQTTGVVGIPFINESVESPSLALFGPFASHLLEPEAMSTFTSSEGDFVDQIIIRWKEELAGPRSDQVKLYRNDILLATFDASITEYVDQNVVAGRYYEYSIVGINSTGESLPRRTIGFLNPNGTITGNITTRSIRAVPDVQVTLSPSLGSALDFDGVDDAVGIGHTDKLAINRFTAEAWIYPRALQPAESPILVKESADQTSRTYGLFLKANSFTVQASASIGGSLKTVDSRVPVAQGAWTHVAMSYDGSQLILYVNGVREGSVAASGNPASNTGTLFIGGVSGRYSRYSGLIDDVRLWDNARTQQQILFNKNRALSSSDTESGLLAYLKMDENMGGKAFDITPNNHDGIICGPIFTINRAPVDNAAFTDAEGNYIIDGINYGAGTTFSVRPSKITQIGRALSLNGTSNYMSAGDRLDLTNKSFSVEGWVRREKSGTEQIVFSQGTSLSNQNALLAGFTNSNKVIFAIGTQTLESSDVVDDRWHHLAFVFNKTASKMSIYVDGEIAGEKESVTPFLGTGIVNIGRSTTSNGSYFGGILDDFRVWTVARGQSDIQAFATKILSGFTDGLAAYWRFNEGSRTFSSDQTGRGNTALFENMAESAWSLELPYREEFKNTFSPESRSISLNPSNTAVNQVNFTNTSMIKVSGYVRYFNSDCFADSVEILVNGKSATPAVTTDKSGKFEVEFEPGSSAFIQPQFEDHVFAPAFYEIVNISEPIANVVFDNLETRTISGKVGGGLCLNPIGPTDITLRSVDGCFEQTITTNGMGDFIFANVPPLVYTVTADHLNPEIDAQLNGVQVNAVDEDVEGIIFRYRSSPIVTSTFITAAEKGSLKTLTQLKREVLQINIIERYIAGSDTSYCPVDTGSVVIQNDAANGEKVTLAFSNGLLNYAFYAGSPNILSPYTKTVFLSVIDDLDRTTVHSNSIVVEGTLPEESKFTTTTPEIPFMILHDPPGDNSYAFMQKDSSFSTALTMSADRVEGWSNSTTLSLGAEYTTTSGIGFAVGTSVETTRDLTGSIQSSQTSSSTNELAMTFTASETISTSASDDIIPTKGAPFVGDGGDIYMGGAMNLIYGVTNVLKVSDEGEITTYKDLIVVPEKFNTTFIYSENFVKENVIPSLELIGDTTSANQWRSFIAKNAKNKEKATFVRNLSFDAGSSISLTETLESAESTSNSVEIFIDESVALTVGMLFNKKGAQNTVAANFSFNTGKSETQTVVKSQTFGYVLADNDPGDNFTLDVKRDPVYGSPVFNLISGATSCPHEPNTFARDRAQLVVEPIKNVNVNPDEPALFRVTVQNLNLEEYRDYDFTVDQSTNPNGALFLVNAVDLSGGVLNLGYGPGASNTFIVEAYRGPIESQYENINFIAGSVCNLNVSDTLSVSFSFRETCSNISIFQPEANFLINGSDDSVLPITINNYNVGDPSIQEVRVQYRRSLNVVSKANKTNDGVIQNNDWIDIEVIEGSKLTESFYISNWQTAPLGDGTYEIRAVLSCSGDPIKTASQVVRGVIDRNAPRILGSVEPADGVLGPDDKILVQFNEPIDQNGINPLEDVLLINTETGKTIDREVSIFSNAISIVPLSEDRFLENKVLRAEINKLSDLRGNAISSPIRWDFLFDKSPVRWSNARVDITANLDETVTFVRSFQNSGGSPISFDLTNLPSWISAFPMNGTLTPGTSIDIQFIVSNQLGAGTYSGTINSVSSLGSEPLSVHVRLLCSGPDWVLNPADFQHSMNLIGELIINSETSTDDFDMIGAFVGTELRGLGTVDYIQGLDAYQVYMNVYSNQTSGETLTFRVWDASACVEYGSIKESFDFNANSLLGTPQQPLSFTTSQLVVQDMTLNKGWTWLSVNTKSDNMQTGNFLKMLPSKSGDIIRAQSKFSMFSNSAGWVGSLDTIRTGAMYQVNLSQQSEFVVAGEPVNVALDTLRLLQGWNWLGYNPMTSFSTNDAMRNLIALNGDIIKSQSQFSVYVAGTGWVGTLTAMRPLQGYLLYTRNGGRFTYPTTPTQQIVTKLAARMGQSSSSESNSSESDSEVTELKPVPWVVNPSEYQYSMSVIARLQPDVFDVESDTVFAVGAFYSESIRGVDKLLHIEGLENDLLFLTIFSNKEEGELIQLELFNRLDGQQFSSETAVAFKNNAVVGTVDNPITIVPTVTTAAEEQQLLPETFDLFQNYPNPFNGNTQIKYQLPKESNVTLTVYNILGQKIATLVHTKQPAGYYTIPLWSQFDANSLATGTYLYELKAGDFRAIRKMVYIK